MSLIDSIVLATDFADASRAAEDFAIELAQRCDATLHVVHGIEPIMGVDDHDSDDFDDFYHRLIDRAGEEMERRSEQWAEHKLLVKHHVQIGPRWRVIIDLADEEDADLVILGRRSYTQSQAVPLGTTSQKVFFGCPKPVLFIPNG